MEPAIPSATFGETSALKSPSTPEPQIIPSDLLSSSQIDTLYDLYVSTYKPIGGGLLSKADFLQRIQTKDFESFVITKNASGNIENAIACRPTESGTKICYVFGEKNAGQARVDLTVKLLTDVNANYYVEASKALANVLLRKAEVPVQIITARGPLEHYYSVKTVHGKKLTFGRPLRGVAASNEMHEFYVQLYNYSKIKMKLNDGSLQTNEGVQQLRNIFNAVSASTDIPVTYKAILMSKLARKQDALQHDETSIKNLRKAVDSISDLEFDELAKDISATNLQAEERLFLEDMLTEKVDNLKITHSETNPLNIPDEVCFEHEGA